VFDFSADGTLRSIEESLERLGVDRLDVVHVHDPDDHPGEALAGAFPTLCRLRDEGVIGAVGCGMNQVTLLRRFVDEVDLDCVLLAGRYTLLDRSGGEDLLPACAERGIGVVLGGVFNSGLLADPDHAPTYDYAPAPDALVARARDLRERAAGLGVPLPAAALGFVLRHEAVTSVIVGARTPAELRDDVAFAATSVPDELWRVLDG
jgi:D-threo-aldose 1-dehydrogenase